LCRWRFGISAYGTIFRKLLVGKMVGIVARPTQKLDPGWVKRTTKTGMHADGGGLYLQLSRFVTKSWIFRYMLDGRRREMGLGPFPAVSLAAAREKAAECRNMIQGSRIDPIEARNAQRAPDTARRGQGDDVPPMRRSLHRGASDRLA
jgi:hypothetical protein